MGVTVPAALPTVTGLLLARARDPEPGLRFEDRRWSWREHVGECARYAAVLRARRAAGRPFHVGVLIDNVPEFWFTLCGAAFVIWRHRSNIARLRAGTEHRLNLKGARP